MNQAEIYYKNNKDKLTDKLTESVKKQDVKIGYAPLTKNICYIFNDRSYIEHEAGDFKVYGEEDLRKLSDSDKKKARIARRMAQRRNRLYSRLV